MFVTSRQHTPCYMRIQKVLSGEGGGGSKFVGFILGFLADGGIEDPNTTLTGPSSALQ